MSNSRTELRKVSIHEGILRIGDVIHSLEMHVLRTEESLGSVLAVSKKAMIKNPRFANSQVDGYALGTPASNELTYSIIGDSYAGRGFLGELRNGEAVKVRTGAPVPSNCKSIVMQEDVEIFDGELHLKQSPIPHENIRRAGADFDHGMIIAKELTMINPRVLGVLVAAGVETVTCYRKPQVKIIATGDEICPLGEKLNEAQIYDSTSPMVQALLKDWGVNCEVVRVGDSLQLLEQVIKNSSDVDFLAIIGGASVGDRDFTAEALINCGFCAEFSKVKMRPGMPTSFFSQQNRVALSVPGNPVSAYVAMLVFGRHIVDCFQGKSKVSIEMECAILSHPVQKLPGHAQFMRGRFGLDREPNQKTVSLNEGQGSHLLLGLSQADCLVFLPEECTFMDAGAVVSIVKL